MVTNKPSKISGVLHRLKYIYPQYVLVAIYKLLFIPHLNYGSLLCGHNFDTVSKLQKKVVGTITNSVYIAHSESNLKGLSLLKVKTCIIQEDLLKINKNILTSAWRNKNTERKGEKNTSRCSLHYITKNKQTKKNLTHKYMC